jgi:type II secretory pathway predicted ATPase ExeA
MFEEFYKLAEQPFGVTPDPRYLYFSPTHSEAMASLMYGVQQNRGFTALIAHPGMGKTTLLFDFLESIHLSARTVFLFQTQLSPRDLMHSLLADLGAAQAGDDLAEMQLKLNDVLVREADSGKKVVMVVDEAQALNEEVLEVLRMLSNFETSREKLIHVVLAGQPQLAERLALPSMIQFRQRISIVARLTPFNAAETRAYIDHRLRVAGHQGWRPIFSDHAYALIAKHSQGIPRNINNLCFNAMSVGCALKQRTIGPSVIYEVLRDLDLRPLTAEPAELQPIDPVVLPQHLPVQQSSWSVHRWLAVLTFFALLTFILFLPIPLAKGHAANAGAAVAAAISQSTKAALPDEKVAAANMEGDQTGDRLPDGQVESSITNKVESSAPLYRVCIQDAHIYLARVFQQLQHWIGSRQQKVTLQFRPSTRNAS